MKSPRRWLSVTLGALSLVLAVASWIVFAPVQLGGQVSYVIVVGNSMEPGFHRGDLALVRQAADYTAGDIVAYRYPGLGIVFHRILEEAPDGRFTMKGDHNTWTDGFRPTEADVIGRLWIHVPGAGQVL